MSKQERAALAKKHVEELENAITESNTSLTTLQTLSKVDGLKRDLIQDFYERINTNERGNVDERGHANEKYHKNS